MDDARDTILRFLRLLYREGDVFEVRAPECRDRDTRFTYTCAGCYTFASIETAAADIAALDARGVAPAIYVTLNPVRADLLARAANRIKAKVRETAQDRDVVARRRLLIDVDPVRPAGISATAGELEAARVRALEIRDFLVGLGWPLPLVVMSGNGVHLIFAVDLPTDDGGLIKRVLEAIAARFSDVAVSVDRAVHNAARIAKCAGTLSRKGEDLRGVEGVEDRPHRRAVIVEAPDVLEVVTREQLEALAGPSTVTTTPHMLGTSHHSETPGPLVSTPAGVRAWLEARGVSIKGERHNGDRTLLLLERCPVNPEIISSGSSDIAVQIGDDGVISYCNKHSRGQAYTWHDVRRALDPHWEPPQPPATGVDLSGFDISGNSPSPPSSRAPAGMKDPGPFPDDLLSVPGFIGDVIAHNLATAHRRQPVLALASAICLQAVLAGRKVRDERNNRTNLYCVGIAPSGVGKEHARKISKAVLFHAGLGHLEGNEDLASDAGLMAAVEQQPAILFQIDELGRFLRTIGDPKKGPHLFNVLTTFMRLYSAADSIVRGKAYADPKKNRTVDQPCVVLYGTSVPSHFFASLTNESLEDGFVARLLVFEADADPQRVRSTTGRPPESIVDVARWWGDLRLRGNLSSEHPEPTVVQATPGAVAIFDQLATFVDEQTRSAEGQGRALWARAEEKACRLALVYACSQNHENPEITEDAARWACALVTYVTQRMLFISHDWVADGQFDARQKRVLRIIREAGGTLGRRELSRRTQSMTQRERQEVVDNLIETEQIGIVVTETSTKPRVDYALR